jgi:mitochondrial inner membrane protease ATP23
VCQNVAKKEGMVQGILAHEMVHMFDYCRHKLDFKNVEHLACTEIRAANLTNCSFMSAMMQGDSSPFRIQQTHRVKIMKLLKMNLPHSGNIASCLRTA